MSPFTVDRLPAPGPVEEVEPIVELDERDDQSSLMSSEAAVEIERGEHRPGIEGQSGEWTGITVPTRRGSSPRFLTDVIVDMGLASRAQVEDALEVSRGSGMTPERVLLDRGALTHDGLARALAERYGLDHLDLGVFSVDMGAANLVSTTAAKRYQAVPVAFADKRTLLVAMADPSNVLAVDDIAIMTGYEVRVAVAPPEDIATLISRLDRLEDVVGEPDGAAIWRSWRRAVRSSSCTTPPRTRPSSSSSTRSSPRRSSRAPPTSTWRPTGASCACASASTACCTTSRPCRAGWRPARSRA